MSGVLHVTNSEVVVLFGHSVIEFSFQKKFVFVSSVVLNIQKGGLDACIDSCFMGHFGLLKPVCVLVRHMIQAIRPVPIRVGSRLPARFSRTGLSLGKTRKTRLGSGRVRDDITPPRMFSMYDIILLSLYFQQKILFHPYVPLLYSTQNL